MALSELDRITNGLFLGTSIVKSGAYLNFAAAGGLKIAGTAMSCTAAELNVLDGVTAGTVTASKGLVVGAASGLTGLGLVQFTGTASGGAAAANAIIAGVGTSASSCSWSAAGKNGLEFRTKSTATSGDSRGLYTRHEIGGAGGSGESLRGNSVIGSGIAAATVHGLHSSVSHETGATATGLVCGGRLGWIIPDEAVGAGGTYYGGMSEIYVSGDSSDPSSVTEAAVHCFSVNGSGNAAAQDKVPYMLKFNHGGNDQSGSVIYSHVHATPTNASGSIKCKIGSATGYLKWYAAE